MKKPLVLAVDDDLQVLQSIEFDLKDRYSDDYRIVTHNKSEEVPALIRSLLKKNEGLALVVSDQRMPGLSGTELLEQVGQISPQTKRVLLTAYADTEAAIQAINRAGVDYYLQKPWAPPAQSLYPVLDDLLESWKATAERPYDGLHLLGSRWSPDVHALRTFLSRNLVPYQFHDGEKTEFRQRLAQWSLQEADLPVVVYPDGQWESNPHPERVAQKMGLPLQAQRELYDLIIVGAGPAGLAAAVYGASEGLRVVLVDKAAPGGQAGTSTRIENYLGFPSGLSGADLARRGVTQAKRFGVEFLTPLEVVSLTEQNGYKHVGLSQGVSLVGHSVLLALGVEYKRLPVPGLDRYEGAGVYYGGGLIEVEGFEGQEVMVVGGGNSAGQAALALALSCHWVNLVVRGPDLEQTMSRYLIDRIEQNPRIRVLVSSEVVEVRGQDHLTETVVQGPAGRVSYETSGLFLFIGAEPRTQWLPPSLLKDASGYVITGWDLQHEERFRASWPLSRDPYLTETSIPGVFAAGDVRSGSIKRVASGVGEGSVTVPFVHRYLGGK